MYEQFCDFFPAKKLFEFEKKIGIC